MEPEPVSFFIGNLGRESAAVRENRAAGRLSQVTAGLLQVRWHRRQPFEDNGYAAKTENNGIAGSGVTESGSPGSRVTEPGAGSFT